MSSYIITDNDFNECIGSWLNADNAKYQMYVQGIKLFKEYLAERETTEVAADFSKGELSELMTGKQFFHNYQEQMRGKTIPYGGGKDDVTNTLLICEDAARRAAGLGDGSTE